MKPTALLLASFPDFLKQPLQEQFTCVELLTAPDPKHLLAEAGSQVRAIAMGGADAVPASLLDRLPALEIISVYGVGYDRVDVAECRRRGIHLTNTPDVLTDDVADIATALVLMTSRRLSAAESFVHAGSWARGGFPLTRALKGKTAGILGLGRIGQGIARRLAAHGMNIAYHGRRPQAVEWRYCGSLEELAKEADFLVVACPGGPATHHLVNAPVLQALGPEGTLINIARGSVVDEAALIHALETGVIHGAGLDVFEKEPHVPAALLACDRVVALPHIGSGTHETRREMARLCVENLVAHFSGNPLLTPVL